MISNGVFGIINKVIETRFLRLERRYCLAHRMRNLAAKISENICPKFRARVTAAYQASSRAIARD